MSNLQHTEGKRLRACKENMEQLLHTQMQLFNTESRRQSFKWPEKQRAISLLHLVLPISAADSADEADDDQLSS